MTHAALNLHQADFFQNPYPYYALMRGNDAPFWLPQESDTGKNGVWLFSRYAQAQTIFMETQAISKNLRSIRPPGTSTPFDLAMLHRDGADHLRLRRLVAQYFSAQYVSTLEPLIFQVALDLLQALRHKDSPDLYADFAEPLPMHVIARLMGIPVSDMRQIRAWSLEFGQGFDSVVKSHADAPAQKQAMLAFMSYVDAQLAAREQTPTDDLLGFLAQVETGADITRDDLIGMAGFLLFAGHETTINLIGNGLWLLLSHPDQLALLRQQPALLASAVEEILRFESPEQRTSFRIAVAPLEVNGVQLEAGQQLGVVIGSANRDETVFTEPDRFDIRRDPNPHLAFGMGLHHCLGKTLARVEARLALRAVLEVCPEVQLVPAPPRWRINSFFRGLETLPVRLGF